MTALDRIRNRSLKCAVLLLLVSGLVGCTTCQVQREITTPSMVPFSASGEGAMPDRWWTVFDDRGLDRQVNRALGDNFELSAALQRLCAARAVARREASDLFPDLNGIIGSDIATRRGPDQGRFSWGLDASYQVDLWGEIQSRVDAQRFRANATHADYHAVALSLAAEVARTWFALIEAHAQLELLDKQVETNRKGLKSQELRFGTGLVLRADVLRQRQLVEATLEQAVVVRSRIELLEHQLAVLLGEMPQEATFNTGAELPELPPLPAAGLPAELLARRPDVRRDYLAYVAADRDLASAISAQYPRLNLTGSLINAAGNPEALLLDWIFSLGGQMIAPLFDGGQRQAEVERASAVVCQLADEYRQSMLIAFREVEDNLASERFQLQRIELLESQVKLAEQAYDSLFDQYQIGDASFLDSLSAIQSLQRLQRELVSARLDLILIRIGLYLSLAGDFDTAPQILNEQPFEDAFDDENVVDNVEPDEDASSKELDTDEADEKDKIRGPLDLPPNLQEMPPDLRDFPPNLRDIPPELRIFPPELRLLPLPPVPEALVNSIDE